MRVLLANYKKYSRKIITLIIILVTTIFSSACAKESYSNVVLCNLDDYSLYPKIVEQTLPSFKIEQSDRKPYHILNDDGIVESFDIQALGAIKTGIAKYWYPQYLATVIIAIDRDQTDVLVSSWSDLFVSKQEVGFFDTHSNVEMLAAAMSYGLEGEDYTLTKTIQLLASLHENGQLKMNSDEAAVIICFDYQAANLIESGRNIEIIIPKEGTFTYEKGLLSNENLAFKENMDRLLFNNKFRLLDGEGDLSIYPDKVAYGPAVKVTDYEHLAKITRNVSPQIQRRALKYKRLMSIDYREHLSFALVYISIITIWTAFILRRSMQKGISYSAFFTGIILNGWALVRLIKYQVGSNRLLCRYLWYSYYIFQLSLPLVILWMAWAVDKPENHIFPPKWWRRMAVLIAGLILLVFTNDLHGFVFQLDLSRPDWGDIYTYGFGYYVIFFVCMMNITAAFIILLKKSINSPKKIEFIFPFGVFFLFVVYNYKYIMRDSLAYETDLTLVTGFFVMFMFESCIRSGLIPVNTKYIDIFTRSPLKIQIINKEKKMVIASALAEPINIDTIEEAILLSPIPVLQEDESLVFANPIPGGYALWSEDVSKIYQLYREIQHSTQKLTEANAILAKEEKIKRSINEKNAKKELIEQLENDIAENIENLSSMIENLEHSENLSIQTTCITLLLCYIKRSSSLFFKEKETNTSNVNELLIYMEELCEIVKYSNVQIAIVNQIKGKLAIRYITLLYDFFYTIADLAVQSSCPYIIVDIGSEEDFITMRILPSVEIGSLDTEQNLLERIKDVKGKVVKKEIEDTIGISLSFPKGGVEND